MTILSLATSDIERISAQTCILLYTGTHREREKFSGVWDARLIGRGQFHGKEKGGKCERECEGKISTLLVVAGLPFSSPTSL